MRQAMLAEQNGCCLICKKPESETTNNLSIDHCHLTHRIRGLLCASCNVGISCFNDDAILIRKTIDYLLLPRDNKPLLNGWQGKVGFHAERFNGLIDWGGRQILAKQQNYCCAICDINESELRRNLEVDHCHNTGVIRGLLCERCNKGLGLFRDKTDVLRTAIQYLSQPKPLTSELADCLI